MRLEQAQLAASVACRDDQADDTIDLVGTPESTIGLALPAEVPSTTWRVNARREAPRLNMAHAALPSPLKHQTSTQNIHEVKLCQDIIPRIGHGEARVGLLLDSMPGAVGVVQMTTSDVTKSLHVNCTVSCLSSGLNRAKLGLPTLSPVLCFLTVMQLGFQVKPATCDKQAHPKDENTRHIRQFTLFE
ncbi:hypothetical protein J3459_013681 [Metarhizium acridum]|nr:hypothetical protein J3459_013681 [Metarhizium acridum]